MSGNVPEEGFDEFVESIAPDVLACLDRDGFFRKLEQKVWPDGPKVCDNTFANTLALTAAGGYGSEEQEDILDVVRSKGGFCDCEVMLNVAPNCEARERHWKKVSAGLEKKIQ